MSTSSPALRAVSARQFNSSTRHRNEYAKSLSCRSCCMSLTYLQSCHNKSKAYSLTASLSGASFIRRDTATIQAAVTASVSDSSSRRVSVSIGRLVFSEFFRCFTRALTHSARSSSSHRSSALGGRGFGSLRIYLEKSSPQAP